VFARLTTLHGDKSRLDTVVDRVDGETRAAVECTEGNRGFAVLTDPVRARVLGVSYWDSARDLRASDGTLAALRDANRAAFGGEIHVERYEVAVAFRHSIPRRGAAVRVTRSRINPTRIDEADVLMHEEVLPRVKGADGLCSFVLLLDRDTGTGMTLTTWETRSDAEAFAPVAEQLRARANDRIGLCSDLPETYLMVRTTAQL
jgi:heme-degrading monooxygenase HmoA